MTIATAHDRFFRKSFGRAEIARNYLEEYLPAEVSALLITWIPCRWKRTPSLMKRCSSIRQTYCIR